MDEVHIKSHKNQTTTLINPPPPSPLSSCFHAPKTNDNNRDLKLGNLFLDKHMRIKVRASLPPSL